jgi:transaldolase
LSDESLTKGGQPAGGGAPAFGGVKLLVDTAEVSQWERLLPSGVFYGVTTNPKLINQAGLPCTLDSLRSLARDAFDLGANEIHLQVWGMDSGEMLERGLELAAIDPRVRVKVPGTPAGFPCARVLAKEGALVTLTALHAAQQTLAAIALGAAYAVPYLGRMNDAGMDGMAEVLAMQEMVEHFPSKTRVLVASIRQMSDMVALARHGVGVYALSPALAEALLENPMSLQAAADFEENARAANLAHAHG